MKVEIENGNVIGYINSSNLAERCGVKQVTIRNWVRRGKLECIKIGSELYFKEDTIKPERKKNKRKADIKEVIFSMTDKPEMKIMSPLVFQMLKYLDQSYADVVYKANDLKERFVSCSPTSFDVLVGCDRASNTFRKYRSEFEAFSTVINQQFSHPHEYGFEIHRDAEGKHSIKCVHLEDLE